MLVLEQLRGSIVWASAGRGKPVVVCLVQGSHSEVGNLDLHIGCDQDVLGLQVAMANIEGMTVCDRTDHLAEEV